MKILRIKKLVLYGEFCWGVLFWGVNFVKLGRFGTKVLIFFKKVEQDNEIIKDNHFHFHQLINKNLNIKRL